MRTRAFTLVEMLVVITVLPFAAIAKRLFAIMGDVPRMTRIVQGEHQRSDLVRHIRDDIDAAVGLPTRLARSEATTAHFDRLARGVICYRIDRSRRDSDAAR